MQQQMNFLDLQSKLSSKRDLYLFLTQDGKAHMPSIKQTNSYFLSDILKGTKNVRNTFKYIRRDQVTVSAIPQLEGLTVADLLLLAQEHSQCLEFLPSPRDWKKIDRQWLGDIINTVIPEQLQAKIDIALKKRAERIAEQRNLNVQLRPEFAEAFSHCLHISQDKGRAVALLKPKSKRKRTRSEFEETKEEESLMKADKKEYMLQVKRLKKDFNNITQGHLHNRSFNMGIQSQFQNASHENVPQGSQSLNKMQFNI